MSLDMHHHGSHHSSVAGVMDENGAMGAYKSLRGNVLGDNGGGMGAYKPLRGNVLDENGGMDPYKPIRGNHHLAEDRMIPPYGR